MCTTLRSGGVIYRMLFFLVGAKSDLAMLPLQMYETPFWALGWQLTFFLNLCLSYTVCKGADSAMVIALGITRSQFQQSQCQQSQCQQSQCQQSQWQRFKSTCVHLHLLRRKQAKLPILKCLFTQRWLGLLTGYIKFFLGSEMAERVC